MRLFIAINFDDATKEKLLSLQKKLRDAAASGNFSRPENLHLTILFLGEVTGDISGIKKVIDSDFTEPFDLQFDRTGDFRGDIYWVGTKKEPLLIELEKNIRMDISSAGLPFDEKSRYTPHITLARQVELQHEPQYGFQPFSMPVRRLSLMKSERINGVLTYTEIYGKTI